MESACLTNDKAQKHALIYTTLLTVLAASAAYPDLPNDKYKQ